MKNLWKTIEIRYNAVSHLILAHGIIAMVLYLFYRSRIYRYILSIHPDIKLGGFGAYLSSSLHYDSAALCFSLSFLAFLLYITAYFRKLRYCLLTVYSVIFIFFLLFSMEFFRVYETTFQKNFAGKEHFTGLGNMLDSALAEFSAEFYILFLLLSAGMIAMNIALYRWEEKTDLQDFIQFNSDLFLFRALRLAVPAIALSCLVIALFTDAPGGSEGSRNGQESARRLSLLRELSMNPVYNLITEAPDTAGGREATPGKNNATFAFGLNTDSLVTDRYYDRQSIIPRGRKYNIILYFFESTPRRYYDIEINGRPVLGTWRRLEKNSLNLRNHYANYPLSANALMSVLTSAYDLNSKDMVIQKYPDIGLQTLPELLKRRNYRTCLIHTGGLGYASQKRFLQNRKFDTILEYNDLARIPPYNRQVGWGIDERAMVKPAIEYLSRDTGRPGLLVLLPVNPHHPYAIPGEEFRIAANGGGEQDYRKRNWCNYLNSLYYSDVSLGMLVDEMERHNLMDNTLLFLFADHGEAFYQHRMNYNHPLFIYNENVHVPFLIYNKKIFPSPEYFDGITRHIDILPTILDILGMARSPEQEGISILSGHREQLALLHTSWKDDFMGVVDQHWKYIRRTVDGIEELYDIRKDPEELNNIAARHDDITKRYRAFVLKARSYKEEYFRRILKK